MVARTWGLDGVTLIVEVFELPGGLVKLEAVKGREGTKKRASAREKESVIVDLEQVDMAGPVWTMPTFST